MNLGEKNDFEEVLSSVQEPGFFPGLCLGDTLPTHLHRQSLPTLGGPNEDPEG
jgi:hypothetical protein